MIEIVSMPILGHIMKIYSSYGVKILTKEEIKKMLIEDKQI
jgi:hypothetical protein